MDAKATSTTYLKLKEFLARNPSVQPRTFSRWKKKGLIDFIQPAGPKTQILVPEDALVRMEDRRKKVLDSPIETEPHASTKRGRKLGWKKR